MVTQPPPPIALPVPHGQPVARCSIFLRGFPPQVEAKVSEGVWEFVPDGMQVWRHYLDWQASGEDSGLPPSYDS